MTAARAIGSVVERFVHTEEVTGSNPVSPTRTRGPGSRRGARPSAVGSSGGPVGQVRDAVAQRLDADQRQLLLGALGEQAEALPDGVGGDVEVQLVDQAVGDQRAHQRGAAADGGGAVGPAGARAGGGGGGGGGGG